MHAARWKCRTQKLCKKSPSAHHRTTLSVYTVATKAYIDNRSLGHLTKFQWVSRLGFVTAPTSLNGDQPNFARCLAVSCTGTIYIHFRGLLPSNGILSGAKFTLCPNLALSYIVSVTARHWGSGRQPNFAAFSRGDHLYSAAITLGIGPHSSFNGAFIQWQSAKAYTDQMTSVLFRKLDRSAHVGTRRRFRLFSCSLHPNAAVTHNKFAAKRTIIRPTAIDDLIFLFTDHCRGTFWWPSVNSAITLLYACTTP